jgi:hypothetical protein
MNERDLPDLLRAAEAIDGATVLMRCPAHGGALSSSLEVVFEAGRCRLRCIAGCTPDGFAAARSRISPGDA